MKVITHKHIKKAILIRKVEEKFLELFSMGKMNGTVHTSVGQEMSAVAFSSFLKKSDFIFSNHRCHGHYIAFTGDYKGLIYELMGKKAGTCGGIGSSQHLCNKNFFSNGVQGGIVPVAAGYALAQKLQSNNNIGVVFIGDGTLGEGVLYETMNIISKWEIPLMIVCENNYYAQSTHQSVSLAGDILKRAEAFDIKTYQSDTWNIEKLLHNAQQSINYTRNNSQPGFHLVNTYRLNAHSKGDDDRDVKEIEKFRKKDFLFQFAIKEPALYKNYSCEIDHKIKCCLDQYERLDELDISEYYEQDLTDPEIKWIEQKNMNERQVTLINKFFKEVMLENKKVLFIGEDVLSPYGGAFKVSKDLSDLFPDQVFSTPISEAAITGIGNGLALAGFKPYIEIMFGDFVTLAFDQLVNHASKFYHMYKKQVNCPVVVRTPMGGRRGYGPTHSQTLDRFLIGIDNVKVVALNTLIDPRIIYRSVYNQQHPVIVLENKTDYGKKIENPADKLFDTFISNHEFPVIRIIPKRNKPNTTFITFGGMASYLLENINDIFFHTEVIPEIFIYSLINPVNTDVVLSSVLNSKRLYIFEEGNVSGSFGSEMIAKIMEKTNENIKVKKIGALPVPIPSVKSLEDQVLPGKNRIIEEIIQSLHE